MSRARCSWRRAFLFGPTVAMAGLPGCASREPALAPPRQGAAPDPSRPVTALLPPPRAAATALRAASPPEWRLGDRWSYGLTSGKESGTRPVEVLQTWEIANIPYYVVRVGGWITTSTPPTWIGPAASWETGWRRLLRGPAPHAAARPARGSTGRSPR